MQEHRTMNNDGTWRDLTPSEIRAEEILKREGKSKQKMWTEFLGKQEPEKKPSVFIEITQESENGRIQNTRTNIPLWRYSDASVLSKIINKIDGCYCTIIEYKNARN